VSTAGVSGLLVISMIALAAPVLAAGVQRARVPEVVIEIVAGIVVGPSVLGWVKIDQPVGLVALLGLAFLLFLAGLEVDLKGITPSRLRAPLAGYNSARRIRATPNYLSHMFSQVRSSRLGLTWAYEGCVEGCPQVKRALPTFCGGRSSGLGVARTVRYRGDLVNGSSGGRSRRWRG
jgi:hypothetical protein